MQQRAHDGLDMAAVAANHARLRAAAERVEPTDAEAILALGAGVLLHGALEPAHAAAILAVVDGAVREQLRAEHGALEEDLQLLREMLDSPDTVAEDVATLSASLLRRLREHIARDERLLYGPLRDLARR